MNNAIMTKAATKNNGQEVAIIDSPFFSGIITIYALDANFAAGSGDAATEFITDTVGYTGFSVDIVDDVAIAANESLLIAWSTTANDETALTAKLDALRLSLTTPDAVGYTNAAVMTATTLKNPVAKYDGSNKIKTIAVATQSLADKNITVTTAE